MLTRLEVDGFKNLVGFSADFGPFTCIAGPNGVGKSNIFDAIQFLSRLADYTITEAATFIRNGDPETANIRDLFCSQLDIDRPELTFAAEMIVGSEVIDDLGRSAVATSTYLRYEVKIGVETLENSWEINRLVLLAETLIPISTTDAVSRLRFPEMCREFFTDAIKELNTFQRPLITTELNRSHEVEIVICPDGLDQSPAGRVRASTAPRTVVGASNTAASPTLLAVRREMQSWYDFSFEPNEMRKPDRFNADPHISRSGGHMAATLNRLVVEGGRRGELPVNVTGQISSKIMPFVSIREIGNEVDIERKRYTLTVQESNGVSLPAASLSDGTLRLIALSILASDSSASGLLCIEEPENGLHPSNMPELVRLIKQLAVDVQYGLDADNSLRQVIVATHSPLFVQLQDPEDMLFATTALITRNSLPVETLRCFPLTDTWRAKDERSVGLGSAFPYLTEAPGAKLVLPDFASACE